MASPNNGACPVSRSRDSGHVWEVPSKKPRPSAERKKFGRKVAQLREQAGLTQEDLAEAVGLNARHLQAIEAGDYWPTLPTLKALRKALKTTWESLCESW